MCDFKPGDEVVCVRAGRFPATSVGEVYIVERVWLHPKDGAVIDLVGQDNGARGAGFWGHNPDRFRKVQRRNLTEWLSQKTKFEEPKRIGENA